MGFCPIRACAGCYLYYNYKLDSFAQNYVVTFSPRHYLLREANKQNWEFRGAENVLRKISGHICKVKWRLLCLLTQDAGSFENWRIPLEYSPSKAMAYSVTWWVSTNHARAKMILNSGVCLSHSAALSVHRLIREKIATRYSVSENSPSLTPGWWHTLSSAVYWDF